MSFKDHMAGYDDLRTLYQIDSLHALKHGQYCPPVLVEIDPTSTCNQKCAYCYTHGRSESDLWLEGPQLIGLFDQLADVGVKAVLLQGTGEPLAHPMLPEAIERGGLRGLSIAVNTNGVLLRSRLQMRILRHLLYVKFSVLDRDADRYARLHGCSRQHWDILMRNIEHAVTLRQQENLGVSLWATVYLDENNFADACAIVKHCKDIGLDYVVIQEATYSQYSPKGQRPYASSLFNDDKIAEMKWAISNLNDENFRVKVVFPLINDTMNYAGQTCDSFIPNFCQGPKLYSTICADGEVYPCWRMWGRGKTFSYGSIYEQTFEEIWRSEKRRKLDEFINTTPPENDECKVCNHARLNEILYKFLSAHSKWMDFII